MSIGVILRFFIDLLNAILAAVKTLVKTNPQIATAPRGIELRTSGRSHGPITRLVSPSDIGERIKPFVFLDRGEVRYTGKPLCGIHPRSGIATLTVVLGGAMRYEDTTGKAGTVGAGGFEWMKAGGGVWHDGGALPGDPLRLFQLWIALRGADERGALRAPGAISAGELVVFEQSSAAIELEARGDTSFVFGSAPKHPHPLVLGYYSVHTSAQALERGEAGIARIGEELRKQGRL